MASSFNKIQLTINRAIDVQRIVGSAVIIARHGNIIFENYSGWANREEDKGVTEKTIFRLGSMTKPVVSASALSLAEKNILTLDSPITEWLPEFRPHLLNGTTPIITIRHLLTHTAGLTYGFLTTDNEPYHSAGVSDGLDERVLSLQENLARIASVPLLFEPGTSWGYSIAIDVIGAILEVVCQQSLEEIVNACITGPLKMEHTHFYPVNPEYLGKAYADAPLPDEKPRLMKKEDELVLPGCGSIHFAPDRYTNKKAYYSGGAGLFGTARDCLAFLEMIRQGGYPVLHKPSIELLTVDAVPEFDVPIAGPGFGFSMGFAVVRDSKAARTPRYAGSYGAGGVYGTAMFVEPAMDLSVVMLTNTALEGLAGAFPLDMINAIYACLEA